MLEQYRPSGKTGVMGIPAMAVTAIGAGAVLGIVYSYAIAWIPIIYACVLATGVLGLLIGLAVDKAARFGKVRNAPLAHLFGLIGGLTALYLAWAWDAAARTNHEVPVFLDPLQLWAYIGFFFENGMWGMSEGGNVTGWALGAIWGLEALIVCGVATVLASSTSAEPFCESCQAWTDNTVGYKRLLPPEDGAPLQQLAEGDLQAVTQFEACDEGHSQSIRLDLDACPTCADTRLLTVNLVQVIEKDDGEVESQTTAILERMCLTAETMETLQQNLDGLPQHAAADIGDSDPMGVSPES